MKLENITKCIATEKAKSNKGNIWIKTGNRWICKNKTFVLTDREILSDIQNGYLKPIK